MIPTANPKGLSTLRGDWLTPWRFLLLLAVLVGCSYPWVLLGAETFFYRDYGVLAYPTVHYHRESFWRGEVPLWNPLSHCGVPFLAQWGTMVLYPLTLLHTVLPLPWALGVFCLAHLWLGGAGMYLLASRWTRDPLGAALAGVAYAFGGLTLSSLMWPNWTAALGWLPWVVYCGERAGKDGGYWLAHGGVVGAFQMLTGVPEVVLLSWFVVALLWFRALIRAPSQWIPYIRRGMLIVVLVGALAAAQLLPFMDLIAHSQRQGGFADLRWSMPVWGWANLVVPLFHCFGTHQGTFGQYGQAFFTSYYPGLFIVFLAFVGCRALGADRKQILLLLLLLGLVLALGPQGYLYSWLKEFIPGIGLGRYPVKFFVLGAFALPLLAAYSVASLQSHSTPRNWLGFGTVAVALLGAGMILIWLGRRHPFPYDQWDLATRNYFARGFWFVVAVVLLYLATAAKTAIPRVLAGLIVLMVTWIDLRFHWPAHNPTLSADLLAPGISELKRESPPDDVRIFIAPWASEQLLHSNVPNPAQDLLGKRLAMWSNLNLLEGIANVGGAMTLRLRHQDEVQKRIEQIPEPRAVLDFLATGFTTASNNPVQWEPRSTALPWIHAGQSPLLSEQGSNCLERLVSLDFDPRTQVLLPADISEQHLPEGSARAEVVVESSTPHYVRFRVEAEKATIVSVAQSYYHPWRAFLNDSPARLWRANHAFQALQVPAGEHVIELRYIDWNFRWGAVVSAMAVVFCWGSLLWARRNAAQGQSPTPPIGSS
jgi:hypothetical protein